MKQHRISFTNIAMAFLAVVALAGVTSCLPDDLNYQIQTGEHRTITIGTDYETPATKAEINDELKFSWTAGDKIAVWAGDGERGRYYPSNAYVKDNMYEVELTGTRDNYAVYPASIALDDFATTSSLKVKLPSEYDITRVSSETFSPLPMIAKNEENRGLSFKHLGGLLRISIGFVPEGTSYLSVNLGKTICGVFPVHSATYIVAGESEDSDATTVKFVLPSGSQTALLNLPVPTGTYERITVTAYDADNRLLDSETQDLSWTCSRAHGKKFSSDNLGWVYVFDNLDAGSVTYTGGSVSLSTSFRSYRSRASVTEPIPFTIQYSENRAGWSETASDWLIDAPTASDGSIRGEALKLKVAAQYNSGTDLHAVTLRNATAKEDFDLSTINVATGATLERSTTANCYVVSAPGTYKFPIVYGNGLQGGVDNSTAYSRMVDHLDAIITTPYIGKQNSGKMSAEVLWTDAIDLVTNVAINDDGDYITFTVPQDRICQGNALIAVLINGVIAWSWHIWVTDEVLSGTKSAANPAYSFMPVCIGWCEGKTEFYASRSCQVKAVQSVSGLETRSVSIDQSEKTMTTGGNCPYYQWGRKDPLQSPTGLSGENTGFKVYYFSKQDYETQSSGPTGSIGTSIQHPYIVYGRSGGQDWCNDRGVSIDRWRSIKTIYDPSPVGFIMPPADAFSGITTYDDNTVWTTTVTPAGLTYGNSLFFPAMGMLGNHGNYSVGLSGNLWTINRPADYLYNAYVFVFNYTHVSGTEGSSNNSHGYSVIPVVE